MAVRVVISREAALEYFRAALVEAMERERVSVGPFTEYYVVNLLVAQVRSETSADPCATLADRYAQALQAPRTAQHGALREVGDTALVSCGLWSVRETAFRRPLDVRYATFIGRRVYARLSALDFRLEAFAPEVFAELADRFDGIVDAMSRMSATFALTTERDIVSLYEAWLRTGSRHAVRALQAQGIVPVKNTSAVKS